MLLSIVVPTFNRVELLRQAVASALSQDSDDFELVVVDDASQDGTWDYLSSLSGVRTYRNPEQIGLAANFNRATELSRGRYVFILQDDDLAEPNLVSTLAAQAGPDLVCFATCLIDGQGENPSIYWRSERRRLPAPEGALYFAANWGVSSTQVIFKRSVFDRCGGMDETFPVGSDAEMILRWTLSNDVLLIPGVLARRRHWEGSVSSEIESTALMEETMRALVGSISSLARSSALGPVQLDQLERDLQASFLDPYRVLR